ncbi:MAG: RDD family protein [Sulfitobacter sp.]
MALLVDWALVFAVTTLLLLPFLRPDETGVRLAGAPLTFTTCKNVTSLPQHLLDLVAPETVARATLCEVRPFGIYNGRDLTMVYALKETSSRSGDEDSIVSRTRTTSTSRILTVALGADDQVIQVITPQNVAIPLVLIILSAVFIARSGQTPGKRLAGLRVQGQGCAMCREVRRLGLFVLFGGISMASGLLSKDMITGAAQVPVWLVLIFGLVLFTAFVAVYIWPLIRWRGAMPYDRATGFEVVRAI